MDTPITYSRVLPRTRTGTTGLSVEWEANQGDAFFIAIPERIGGFAIAIHKSDKSANIKYVIETSCNTLDKIGNEGTGGYWDNIFGPNAELTEETVSSVVNYVTACRVRIIEVSNGTVNIAICG